MRELSKLGSLIRRELIGELRTRDVLTATLVFPPLVLVIFRFAFAGQVGEIVDWRGMTPGILWTALAFSGILSLSRSFAAEKDDERWLGLLLAPLDRGTLFLSKAIANTLYLIVVAAVTLPVYQILYPDAFLRPGSGVFANWPGVTVVTLLGLLGIASAGSLLSAISVNTRAREALLPLLMFPVLVPVLIPAVQASHVVLDGDGLAAALRGVLMLGLLDIVLLSAGWLLFEFVVEE